MDKVFVIDNIDDRNQALEKMLLDLKCECYDYSNSESYDIKENIVYVFSPKSVISEFDVEKIHSNSKIVAFNIDSKLENLLEEKNCSVYNPQKCESFRVKNSVYTAEGSLKYIIENMPIAFEEINALIFGYGYLGKEISNIFDKLNISYIVCVAKIDEYFLLDKKKKFIDNSTHDLRGYNLIVNTIDAKVVPNKVLLDDGAYVLELASNNFAFNYEYQKYVTYTKAKAIPSTTRKISSAKLLLDYILKYICG